MSAQKSRIGRLQHGALVLARWPHLLEALFASELALSMVHMRTAGALEWEYRDPFDRMLVAQAQLDGLRLVTKEERIRAFPDVACADWR